MKKTTLKAAMIATTILVASAAQAADQPPYMKWGLAFQHAVVNEEWISEEAVAAAVARKVA
jgi:hypothetical protein